MSGLREGYKEPYSQQAGCIISLALSDANRQAPLERRGRAEIPLLLYQWLD